MTTLILRVFYFFLRFFLKKNIEFHGSAKIYFPRIVTRDDGKVTIGENVRIERRNHLEATQGSAIVFKNYSTVNYNSQFYGDIHIGEYCIFASEIYMSSFSHDFRSHPTFPIKFADKLNLIKSNPIYIENDVWIGKNTFIGPGVYVAKGCVIGANVKLMKSIYAPYTIVHNANPLVTTKRLVLDPRKAITSEPNCLPFFYRGFEYTFDGDKLSSITGEEVYFLIPFDYELKRITISLQDSSQYVEKIASNQMFEVYYNGDRRECSMISDQNILKISNHLRMHFVKIIYSRNIEFKNIHIIP